MNSQSEAFSPIDTLCINTIRTLSIDAVEKANSGHPGLPLGAAPMAYVLWQRHLKHDPKRTDWADRDRFILSPGHGSMLLYSLLHLTGYPLSLDEVKNFRQLNSKTPGHPESFITEGVEATTGPLGQGTANAVGMAIAERHPAHRYNRPGYEIINHYTYAIVSDGDLMEGISTEAASLAGHLKLGKLIYLYDANQVTLDGPASLTFTEDVGKRYESYGWQVLHVQDGDKDFAAIDQALIQAKAALDQPSLIIVNTTIGFGSPKAGTCGVHGSPLNKEEILKTKKELGWPSEQPFFIPNEALAHFSKAAAQGQERSREWDKAKIEWAQKHPELASEWEMESSGKLPANWNSSLSQWKTGEQVPTRKASGQVMNEIANRVSWLIGGDADLSVSTNTFLKNHHSFDGITGKGRNIHYGVREHAMAGIANGIAYHKGCKSFVATFFCFADYMRPSIRLAAMNHLPVIYIWTHDSIGLGEDGPTHQPIEHLMSLRVIPNFVLLRPCDANETREAWKFAMSHSEGPVGIVLSRQNLPVLEQTTGPLVSDVSKGAYVVSDLASGEKPQALLIATGSEVHLAVEAQKILQKDKISTRVISMPSWELFQKQSRSYQESVIPSSVKARVSVEAGTSFGWEKWIGDGGTAVSIDHFGASAPAEVLMKTFGFTPEHIAGKVKSLIAK